MEQKQERGGQARGEGNRLLSSHPRFLFVHVVFRYCLT